MSCPITAFVPPTFDASMAADIAGKVATSTGVIARNVSSVTGAISGLESELLGFKFDSGFAFGAPGAAPGAPSIGDLDITVGTPTSVTPPAAGNLSTPGAPSVEVGGFTESALAVPDAPAPLGTFTKPAAPSGGETATPPALPDFSGSTPPEPPELPDTPEPPEAVVPEMPELEFDFGSLMEIVGYTPPGLPDEPGMNTEFMVTEAADEYEWLTLGDVDAFLSQWLTGASTSFTLMKNAGAVGSAISDVVSHAANLWGRIKGDANDGASVYVQNSRTRYAMYLAQLEANFDLRTNVTAKSAAISAMAGPIGLKAALDLTMLEQKIGLLEEKMDTIMAGVERSIALTKLKVEQKKAEHEIAKAEYEALSVKVSSFQQQVQTLDAVVGANRAAAGGYMSVADATSALLDVDEGSLAVAKAKVDAAQAEVQALKTKEIEADLQATIYKGKVQAWRATLGKASAEVSANKAELAVVSAKNQALAQQVAAINSDGFKKVAGAQLSVAKAQVAGAKIKTDAMTVAAEIQKGTAENQISAVEAKVGYLNAAAAASAPMAKNEAVAVVNDAIARSNQAIASIAGDANSGVRQAAQSQASAGTAMTDVAFRYNAELAKAFAALNAGKLAGYRISTSQRMTGEMGVRFNMSARKDKSYSGSLSQSDDCETTTTHEESV